MGSTGAASWVRQKSAISTASNWSVLLRANWLCRIGFDPRWIDHAHAMTPRSTRNSATCSQYRPVASRQRAARRLLRFFRHRCSLSNPSGGWQTSLVPAAAHHGATPPPIRLPTSIPKMAVISLSFPALRQPPALLRATLSNPSASGFRYRPTAGSASDERTDLPFQAHRLQGRGSRFSSVSVDLAFRLL